MSIRVGTAKQAQMVMGLSEYELLRAQTGMGMGIPAHSTNSRGIPSLQHEPCPDYNGDTVSLQTTFNSTRQSALCPGNSDQTIVGVAASAPVS
eukprot:19804-Heterococcus_DN1.PRE.1